LYLYLSGQPIGRANSALALGPAELGAPAKLVVSLAVVEISGLSALKIR
jgi:hypothetical protein